MSFQKLGGATSAVPAIDRPPEAPPPPSMLALTGRADGITTAKAAAILGLKPKTLANWRCKGGGPSFIKYGDGNNAPVRYDPTEVIRYRDQHWRRSTSDRGGKTP